MTFPMKCPMKIALPGFRTIGCNTTKVYIFGKLWISAFQKIYTLMGLCPVIFWHIAGNYVQLYATPNLCYWPLGVLMPNLNVIRGDLKSDPYI